MPKKPTAAEIKKLFRELRAVLPDNVPPSKTLRTLANHPAVLKLLAREHPPAEEDALRRMLARLAGLAGVLEDWIEPSRAASEKKLVSSAGSEEATEAAGSEKAKATGLEAAEAAGSEAVETPAETFSDPAALAGHEKIKVFVDGASKGNPGPASIGLVFTDLEGNTLFEEGVYIGEMTNNAAEYHALIRALEVLVERGCSEAYVFSDSELMVKQIRGLYKIKSEGLRPLVAKAQSLRRKLLRFQIAHVPRAKNKRADHLANLAFRQARDAGKI